MARAFAPTLGRTRTTRRLPPLVRPMTVVPSDPAVSRSIPKAETNVLDLMRRLPNQADGRGIKIAILDTGCDLLAAGLQTTSDGQPKYLDFLDCTGGGDVDVSHVVTRNVTVANNDNRTTDDNNIVTITGRSGRNLTLGADWAANVTEFRLGTVPLYRLLPTSVQKRLKKQRHQRFAQRQHNFMAKIQHKIDELHDRRLNKATDDNAKNALHKQLTDQRVLLEQMQSVFDTYEDAGPLMDVLMFEPKPGDWRVVLDVQADGNLTNAVPMAPFAVDRQVGVLGFGTAVSYCVQVYDDGDILSLVTDAGSHGTHVAGIAAAFFPSKNVTTNNTNNNGKNTTTQSAQQLLDRNGVAPGAQILACKIGDGRLGSAETGTGLVRALIAAKKYGCDLINLSYGEPSWQPDSGRVAQTFADAVHKWNMAVFTSAGNDGPALSSLGSPGTLSAPITVGAFVSPDMMVDQYSTLPATDEDAPLRDTSYHFSSRGPTPDGILPDLCAPGGAIAPIPRHALQGKAQYHGTSMSSPNACGVAACVLSALKSQGIENVSPTELRRGLVNSAKPVDIPDPFAQGSGLVSATGAFDYIVEHHGKPGQGTYFDVRVTSRNNARGIYVRDPLELQGPLTFHVNVQPRFSHSIERSLDELEELLALDLDIKLVPSRPWVHCPSSMNLFSAQERGGQSFAVRLTGILDDLEPGVHFATVDALDANDAARGPLFQVPITVIIPHSFAVSKDAPLKSLGSDESILLQDNGIDYTATYRLLPGVPNRRFLSVPSRAEWATLRLKSLSPDASETSPQRIMMHAIPFARGDLPNGMVQLKKLMALTERVEKVFHMKVKGGSTLEICLQLLWLANPAPADVVLDIEFHSLSSRSPSLVSSQHVVIPTAQGFARLGVAADLRSEQFKPNAKLNTVRRTISPSTYQIESGSNDQDILPPSDAEMNNGGAQSLAHGREIYSMTLEYNFKVDAGKDTKVTPSIPSLFHQLYDSPLDSQIWVLEDSNRQVLAYGGSMHPASAVALEKGDYKLTYYTRHPSRQVLEQVKDVPLQLSFALSDKDSLDCKIYFELDKASTPSVTGDGRKPVKSMVLSKGSFQDVYVARPTGTLPSWTVPGDVLVGTITLDTDIKQATSISLSYTVPPKSKVEQVGVSESSAEKKEPEKTLEETLFESKVSFLSKIRQKDRDQFEQLATELMKENATHIPLLEEALLFAIEAKEPDLDAVRQATNAFFVESGGPIDEKELAQYFGVSSATEESLKEDADATKLMKEMDEEKRAVQSCLLAFSQVMSSAAVSDAFHVDEFHNVFQRMRKWVSGPADLSKSKDKMVLSLVESRHLRLLDDKPGAALSTLLKTRGDLPDHYKDISNEILSIYKAMNHAEHLVEALENELLRRFPPE